MVNTFFFYDLETSGFSPRFDRIMQFAGQRTDMDLKPIGKPIDVLVKLSEDILPSPDALLVTKITPQQTVQDGLTEAEFTKLISKEVFTPNTIAVGYNNIRFDDEFIRHALWRNFHDPYEWAWANGRSRWDLLDAVRLVRALRPDGINWPVKDGKPINRLELLAQENGIKHEHAHNALSDVLALIELAKLVKTKQPKTFEYLLKMRDKKEIARLVNLDYPQPFIYTSGRFGGEHESTTVCFPVAPGNNPGSTLVYDLRYGPADLAKLSRQEIVSALNASYEERKKGDYPPVPVKELQYNRCPAVAPLGVLDGASQERLNIDLERTKQNAVDLEKNRDVLDKIIAAWNDRPGFTKSDDVEGQLYDSFIVPADKPKIQQVREADEQKLADLHPSFVDERLPELLFRYKARNYPKSLSSDERVRWDEYRKTKLQRELPEYMERLSRLGADTDDNGVFVLEEMQLWVESILSVDD